VKVEESAPEDCESVDSVAPALKLINAYHHTVLPPLLILPFGTWIRDFPGERDGGSFGIACPSTRIPHVTDEGRQNGSNREK
jgi:hypothetical protein